MNWLKRKYYNWQERRIFKKYFGDILDKPAETATGRFVEISPDKLREMAERYNIFID